MPSTLIDAFDVWRPGYGLASVRVVQAGTDTNVSIFSDEALTAAVSNPVVLAERIVGGISYGKFSAPIYVGSAYELIINSIERTGIERVPLTTLDGEDASEALVTVTGGTQAIALEDQLARRIDVRDFGAFIIVGGPGASASTNNATLVAALAAAASAGGGIVELPGGTYAHTTLTIPQGCVLQGQGRVATTLQSTSASAVFTLGGTRAGFSRLTLDGVTLVTNSIGVYAANKDEIVFDDVEVKRFDTGIDCRGGAHWAWRDLFISNCANGAKLYGDAAGGAGGAINFNQWRGGRVELCGTTGVDIRYVDEGCEHIVIDGIVFDTNTGIATKLVGARAVKFPNCEWTGNTTNLTIEDHAAPLTNDNTTIAVEFRDGKMTGGDVTLTGTLDTVAFRRMTLSGVAITLTSPGNDVLIEDCREDNITLAGGGFATAWFRATTGNHGRSITTTTDATTTKSWARTLQPGEHAYLESRTVARRINGTDNAFRHIGLSFRRPGSSLAYETQTANFTTGTTLTGATSGATARLVSDTDVGVTGTLTLYDIDGTFLDDEIITDGLGGSATVNGTLTDHNVQLLSPATLLYTGQTVNFTVGATLIGGTSGATAAIVGDTDAGTTGALTISGMVGLFIGGETIIDTSGGSATTGGPISYNATLELITTTQVPGLTYQIFGIGNGAQVEVRVQGLADHTVEWTQDISIVTNVPDPTV